MDDLPTTNISLLVRVRDPQNGGAWEEFIDVYTPLVRNYLRGRGLQEADAMDVSQDVMQAISTAIRKFEYDSQRGRFRSWLFTVIRSKLNNFFASRKRHPQGSGDTAVHMMLQAQPSQDEQKAWDEEYKRHLFHWAAEQIRPEFQEATFDAFWQVAVGEKPAKQVAESLGMTPGAVYIAKSRVIKRLTEKVRQIAG